MLADFQDMVDAYIEAIYFTDTGDEGQPPSDVKPSEELENRAKEDCLMTIIFVAGLHSADPLDYTQLGHDLWLTRNRHGAGFWDGDWPSPLAESLTEFSNELGECVAYLGDDKLLYLE